MFRTVIYSCGTEVQLSDFQEGFLYHLK